MVLSNQFSLKQRVLKAGIWSLVGFALSMLLRLGSNLIMARLLAPEMFGIVAIAFTLISGLAMFSDVGLRQSIVQSERGHDVAFLNTAWAIQILRGLLIWLVALGVCALIAVSDRYHQIPSKSVYAAPELPFVLAALSFSTAIAGFESTKLFEASRSIALGRITGIEIVTQVAGLVCMISWVLVDRSIWALVFGAVLSSMVRTILTHVVLPGTRNSWQWNSEAAREVIHFGKWILLSSMLGFLVNSGDRLLLGGMVSSTTLGLYSIAYLFVGSVEGVTSKIMSDVAFPTFSEIVRTRPADLKKNYYKVLVVIASIAYFSSGFLMTFGQTLVDVLYDPRYRETGRLLELLAAILLTIPFRLSTQSFLALGKPQLQSVVILLRLITVFGLTPLGFYYFGFEGAVGAIILSHFSYVPIIVYYNVRNDLFDGLKELYLLALLPIGLIAGEMATLIVRHVLK